MALAACSKFARQGRSILKLSVRKVSSSFTEVHPKQEPSSSPSSHYFHPSFQDESMKKAVLETMTVHKNFISSEEELSLVAEISPRLKRMRWEVDHWDSVIFAFKETDWPEWKDPVNARVIARVRETAFPANATVLGSTHVLDMRKDGFINPHVDAVRFCGDTVAGICCLSSSVMRFRHERRPELVVDFLLPRYGLYVMTGVIRYEFTHEILKESESRIGDEPVPRDRRISIICREPPRPENIQKD